jgi:hypothetical protein
LFGFAATFTVANLYYNQPLLFILANEWGVQYLEIPVGMVSFIHGDRKEPEIVCSRNE